MDWKIAAAKQKISELVKAAENEPQSRALGEAFEELRRICAEEEGCALEIPPRQEQLSPFLEAIAAAPLQPKMTWDALKAVTREP